MPPSGFNQTAINGLLEFVQVRYQAALQDRQKHPEMSERDYLVYAAQALNTQIGVVDKGLAVFVAECFSDLAKEIDLGKDKYDRTVEDGKAIQKELNQIRDYLTKFTI